MTWRWTFARTRFPFPNQTTWPPEYVTLTNVPERMRAIETPAGPYYPDIVIVDHAGRVRELGEVEMDVSDLEIPRLSACSEATDNDTPTGVRHFFLYVSSGSEAKAQALLEENGVSYAGVRGFAVSEDGRVTIEPFVTRGDPYDHQSTGAPA